MSKLMSIEKIENRIKMVVELVEHTRYTSLKSLAEDSGMPQYQLKALLLTGFLFKSSGMCYCTNTIFTTMSLEKMFFSGLAEAVQDIYKHRKFPDVIASYEVQYNYKRILESAEKKLEEIKKEQDCQAQVEFQTMFKKEIDPYENKHTQKLSFWQKLKNFFTWKK